MTFKNKQTATLRQRYELVGRPPTGKPRKNKNIKVTEKVHRELSEMGTVSMEMGDVVEMLLEFWKKNNGIIQSLYADAAQISSEAETPDSKTLTDRFIETTNRWVYQATKRELTAEQRKQLAQQLTRERQLQRQVLQQVKKGEDSEPQDSSEPQDRYIRIRNAKTGEVQMKKLGRRLTNEDRGIVVQEAEDIEQEEAEAEKSLRQQQQEQ